MLPVKGARIISYFFNRVMIWSEITFDLLRLLHKVLLVMVDRSKTDSDYGLESTISLILFNFQKSF